MTSEQFAYWLNGYLEMSGAKTLGEKEVQILKDHLALVFEKKTPEYWKHQLGQLQQPEFTVESNNPPEFICNLQTNVTC